MCGIVGVVSKQKQDKQILKQSLNSLSHRGPDGQDSISLNVFDKSIWLGHTRLAILDLSPAGSQPMKSRDGRWIIVFNGEVYNHLELRKKLRVPFRGHSDTETLVELLAMQGIEKTLHQLNGMFAFAAVDTVSGNLYLARDPFGIKPIYYIQEKNLFTFASEIRALKAMNLFPNEIDDAALKTFLALRYVPSPKTLQKNVRRLPPGHCLRVEISSNVTRLQRYAMSTQYHFSGTIHDATNVYQEKLTAAVKRQLLSDVPVGLLLSGGIDSAMIGTIAKNLGYSLPSFTVGFETGYAESEIEDAEETARTLGLPFYPIRVSQQQLLEALPVIVNAIEEPLGTTSIMPMWYLVQEARKKVTVVLTGQGNDEPWGGYRRYQIELIRQLFPYPKFWQYIYSIIEDIDALPEILERGLRTLPQAKITHRMLEASALFSDKERSALLGDTSDGIALSAITDWVVWAKKSNIRPTETMMRVDTRMNLSDDLLLYGDKITMSVSLEARVPMLDIALIRFVESLPLKYRVSLWNTKKVHKRMARRFLPSEIVNRPKKGFQVPFGQWSRGAWRDYVEATLFASNAKHLHYFDKKTLAKFWQQHLEKKPDRSRQMFALLTLALWFQD